MEALLVSLKGTWIGTTVASSTWMFAACEALHFIGLFILVGGIAILDLRVLGMARDFPVAPIHKLLPIAFVGFFMNLVTGTLFFLVDPVGYGSNPAFQVKMALVVLAGLNAFWFELGYAGQVAEWGARVDAPFQAKVICGLSLIIWGGVITAGRLLPAFSIVL